jgi:hypothetical protein
MGGWDDAAEALRRIRSYATEQGLWFSVVHEKEVTEDFIQHVRDGIYETYAPWTAGAGSAG